MNRFFSLFVVLFVLSTTGLLISHRLHEWGRTNRAVHEVVMTLDLFGFVSNGGGFYGASNNYFGWRYAKSIANPDRPLWHKLMYWPNPFYLTPPPDEWPYEYQGG